MSNISILSRGNFLNSSSIVFAVYKQMNKHRDIFFIISGLIIFLFSIVYLVVEELVGVNSTMNTCDNGDSTGTFNLKMAEVNIGGGVGYEVTWYSDADRAIEITDPTSYTTAATTVYASIQVEGESSCSADAEVALQIGEIQAYPASLRECNSSGGTTFDLTKAEDFITVAQQLSWWNGGTDMRVDWTQGRAPATYTKEFVAETACSP